MKTEYECNSETAAKIVRNRYIRRKGMVSHAIVFCVLSAVANWVQWFCWRQGVTSRACRAPTYALWLPRTRDVLGNWTARKA